MNTDCTSPLCLISSNALDIEPDWFGSTIAFSSNRRGMANYEIYTMDVNRGEAVQLTAHPAHDSSPSWSPYGSWITFASDRSGARLRDLS